jgi:hypothetical protein
MLEHFPRRVAPVDREIESLVSGLIRNGNQIDALRQALGQSQRINPVAARLLRANRETEARLQVLIAGVERRSKY